MSAFTIWEGIYPGFAEAPGAGSVTGDGRGGFEGPQWLAKSIARAEAGHASLTRDCARGAHDTANARTLKSSGLSREYPLAHAGTRALRILDFGGVIGNSFPAVRAALPQARPLAFHCIENAQLSARGRTFFLDFPEIVFHESLAPVPSPVDNFPPTRRLGYSCNLIFAC